MSDNVIKVSAGSTEGEQPEPPEVNSSDPSDPNVMRGQLYDNFRRYGETYVLAQDSYERPGLTSEFFVNVDILFAAEADAAEGNETGNGDLSKTE